MSEPIVMSAEALDALHAEIAELEGEGRREIAERIRIAREWGDLKENAEYHDAKKSQAMLETRILQLRETALNAEVREVQRRLRRRRAGQPRDRRRRGARPRVGLHAGAGDRGRRRQRASVSFESPVGRALDGVRVGDIVVVPTPKGERRLVVRSID